MSFRLSSLVRGVSFANLKTRPKILLVAAVPLVLCAGAGLVTISNLEKMAESTRWVDHTQRVLGRAEAIIASAVDMETGLRGYLLAGQDTFLEPYQSGELRAYDLLSELQNTVSDNPPQVARLQEAEQTLRDWQNNVASQAIALRQEVGDAPTMNDMAGTIRDASGKTHFDAVQSEIDAFIKFEKRRLAEEKAALMSALTMRGGDFAAATEIMRSVDAQQKLINQAKDLLQAATGMETNSRGFLLTGNQDEFLTPYASAEKSFGRLLKKLSKGAKAYPEQLERLARVDAIIKTWKSEIVDPTIALRREIGDAATMDNVADFVAEGHGKTYFDHFRGIMAEFSSIEQELMVQRREESVATSANTRTTVIVATALAIVLGGAMALLIGSGIARGVRRINTAMEALAAGDNNIRVEGQRRKDEIGAMARALDVFRSSLAKVQETERAKAAEQAAAQNAVVQELSNGMSALANGDLTARIPQAFPADYEQLRQDFNGSVDRLNDVIGRVVSAAQSIRQGAAQIDGATNDLSHRTTNQAATLEQTAAAMEQLASSVNAAADRSRNVETITQTAREEAQGSGVLVKEAVTAMDQIKKSSSDIVQIVKVIDDIAFQTNLLSLNAGVEAARAGSAGKGFAVVASEVQGLAQHSAQAATQIRSLIEETTVHIDQGVGLVGKTGSALSGIVEQVTSISELVSEIARGASEQSSGLQEINAGVAQLDTTTQQNTGMVQDASSVASQLTQHAGVLDTLVAQFRLDDADEQIDSHRIAAE